MTLSESSAEENTQVAPQLNTSEPPAEDANKTSTAESSAADDGEKGPKSLLDAVKAAVKPDTGAAGSPAAESGEGKSAEGQSKPAGEKPEGEEEDLGEVTDEELRGYHSKTRRRVKQLLGRIQERDDQLGKLQPKAQHYDQIVSFCQTAGMNSEEVNTLFNVGATLKSGDPEKALEMIEPYYQALLKATGRLLPDDLRQDLETGRISEQRAHELSRMRARTGFSQEQVQRTQDEVRRRDAEAEHKQTVADVGKAVTEWERQQSASDPDYKLKAPRVTEKIELAFARGVVPRNAKEAIDLAVKCKKEVDDELGRILPKKREIREVTGGTSVNAAPPPTSTLEAIKRAVGQ